jgi:type II secretory pathway pseudopilin PulG
MKLALFAVVLVVALVFFALARRRAAAREAQAVAQARARTARSRQSVPTVSNNVKGVTASQTMPPYRPSQPQDRGRNDGDDERAA